MDAGLPDSGIVDSGVVDSGIVDAGGFDAGGFDAGSYDAGTPPAGIGASTGWLTTEFAVDPGEVITLRIAIWDSSDSALDSLAVIDHMHFRFRDAPPPPKRPVTMPSGPD
jgi:hypothetical protein